MQSTKPQPKGRPKIIKKVSSAKMTKGNQIIALLKRARGTTIAELSKVTGWQAHSVRGFLSGTVKKRLALALTSERDSKGTRRYRIKNKSGR